MQTYSVGNALSSAFGLSLPDALTEKAAKGICGLCGQSELCIPSRELLVMSTSEIPELFRISDCLCVACASAFKASTVLIGSLLATYESGQWCGRKPTVSTQPNRPCWRELVYTIAHGTPTVAVLSSNTKRRLWHRAAVSSYGNAWHVWYVHEGDERVLSVDVTRIPACLALIEKMLSAGFSKEAIRATLFLPTQSKQVSAFGVLDTLLAESQLAAWRSQDVFTFCLYIAQGDDK